MKLFHWKLWRLGKTQTSEGDDKKIYLSPEDEVLIRFSVSAMAAMCQQEFDVFGSKHGKTSSEKLNALLIKLNGERQ